MVKYHEMKEIVAALLLWIGANTDYNIQVSHPTIIFMPQSQMEKIYYGEHEPIGTLYGFYNMKEDFIVLQDIWNKNSPWHMSVLLHELIHYVQDQNNIQFQCNAEMERESWPLQQKYLKEIHNFEWDYDGLWHMMVSTCPDPYNGATN